MLQWLLPADRRAQHVNEHSLFELDFPFL